MNFVSNENKTVVDYNVFVEKDFEVVGKDVSEFFDVIQEDKMVEKFFDGEKYIVVMDVEEVGNIFKIGIEKG